LKGAKNLAGCKFGYGVSFLGVRRTRKSGSDRNKKEGERCNRKRVEAKNRERERDGNKKEKRKKLVAKTNLKLANIYVKCAV
jgi:hypothetical protein